MWGRLRIRWRPRAIAPVLAAALIVPAAALAAFPGSDPNESVRVNTPNDPDYDSCESDNPGGATCSTVFDEEWNKFGFAPSSSQSSATYHNPGDAHTQRMVQQNTLAGRNPLGQVSGVSQDRAHKYSIGDPSVRVAIEDTGIRWENQELRTKVALNRAELPKPQHADGSACGDYDCNGDGAFNVDDYAGDARVKKDAGDDTGQTDSSNADKILDASDLIHTFSDGTDADHNGYVDDIAGWDFFTNDNDPYDASSYSSAENHGSGRAEDALAATDNNRSGTGLCPRCQLVPLRVWDTFVVDTNNFAQGTLYAADNGVQVVEGAVGGLFNSSFARHALEYAYRHGTFLALVSSDLNTADHNIPTLYNEAMQVQGTVPDVNGLGQSGAEVGAFLGNLGIPTNAPVGTWFRNSGTTQYGGHAHIVMGGTTGSQATGQAAGAAGLIASYARQRGITLAPNEIKQLFTMTAEDVVPENTVGTGVPDPSQPGWDQHFGYGRPDLGLALERIHDGKIPPQALITSPQWFEPFEVSRSKSFDVAGRLSARSGSYKWQLQWAPGIQPAESEFRNVGGQHSQPAALEGKLGTIDLNAVRAALDARQGGGATNDPTAPSKGPGDRDPNEPAFTVRVQVTDGAGNHGEDRKVLFAYRDGTLRPGFPSYVGSGGEQSERLFDLNGDNKLDLVQATSSGDLRVLDAAGKPVKSFNGGRPVHTDDYFNVHAAAAPYRELPHPHEVLTTPAIGDVNGDRSPDIVASAGEHVYAWDAAGKRLKGFPVRLDPDFSKPQDQTKKNHVKRGFGGSVTLGDLNHDGRLDIAVPGLDQHLYAWDGRGKPVAGFPVYLRVPSEKLVGAESINTAAEGDVDGDHRNDVVVPTAEIDDPIQSPEGDVANAFRNLTTTLLANALGKTGRTYAVNGKGKFLKGWPVKPNGIVPDALPYVGPGVDYAMGDVDGDGKLDIVGGVATGDVQARHADGSVIVNYDSQPQSGDTTDKSKVVNLFENPIVANLDGKPGLEVIKGGLTLNQLLNIGVATGQNLPYNHVVQAWDGKSGNELPAYPQAVEDFQLLSSPAVADVSDAPGKEILVGTGLYLLRDLNANGTEGAGFPKFTGGWNYAVPAVGDMNGDGKLDIALKTREGWSFAWSTSRPACGTNDEWWTSRHDEWSSGAYGTDSRPPGTPRAAQARAHGSKVDLSWVAPGGDWMCGKAKRAVVLASGKPIHSASQGKPAKSLAAAKLGATQRVTVKRSGRKRYYAVLYEDAAGNWGHTAALANPGRKLTVKVTPRKAKLAKRTCFRVTVKYRGRPVRGAKVHLVGKNGKRTNRRGRARICRRFFTPGQRKVIATKRGYTKGSAKVRALPAASARR